MTKQRVHSSVQLKDGGGNTIDFHISDGENIVIDLSSAYTPPAYIANKGFFICPLVAGALVVRLIGQEVGDSFTIPAARINANIGLWMEEKCAEVISGTVSSALIGWSY
jgi:hypothetical protein